MENEKVNESNNVWIHILKSTLFAFAGLALTLAFIEAAVRVFARHSYGVKFYTSTFDESKNFDDFDSWEDLLHVSHCPHQPGTAINGFVLNSHGFLSPETSYGKKDNQKRIVFVGDSYAVGFVPYNKVQMP